MTDTAGPDRPGQDPFVRQVTWLIDEVGGRAELSRASGGRVSPRTLDYWCRGRYPRNAVTGAVRDLDAWALASVPGYPDRAGVPRLVETCGVPRPAAAEPAPTAGPTPPAEPPPPAEPAPLARRRSTRALLAAAAAAAVLAAGAVTTVLVVRSGDGTLYPETTGSLGAHTFADPRTPVDNSLPVPPDTTVQVRCRYYAPSIPASSRTGSGTSSTPASGPAAGPRRTRT